MSIRTVSFISGGGSTNLAILLEQRSGGRLHGLVKTEARICDNSKAGGIEKAEKAGFPREHIHLVSKDKGALGDQIIAVLDDYGPDWFHQLGWLPLTPSSVLKKHRGLNQHLGPGGKYMIGAARVFTHMRFCEIICQSRPIPVFCQLVAPDFDDGNAVLVKFVDIRVGETVEEVAARLLPIEHEVQIEALKLLAHGYDDFKLVPRVYQTEMEMKIMNRVRLVAHEIFNANEDRALKHQFYLP